MQLLQICHASNQIKHINHVHFPMQILYISNTMQQSFSSCSKIALRLCRKTSNEVMNFSYSYDFMLCMWYFAFEKSGTVWTSNFLTHLHSIFTHLQLYSWGRDRDEHSQMFSVTFQTAERFRFVRFKSTQFLPRTQPTFYTTENPALFAPH